MRKIITRILVMVFVASIVCVAAMLVMISNVTAITDLYQNNLSIYSRNREDISKISQDMYYMESLLWLHILNDTDEEGFDEIEQSIEQSKAEIEERFDTLDAGLPDRNEKELLHQVSKNYTAFANHISVVTSLSRSGANDSATYYVNTNMIPYLRTARDTLLSISELIDGKCVGAESSMDSAIAMVGITKVICIAVVGFIIILCISLVLVNSRRIISQQELERESHQQRIMNLQYQTIVSMANLIENRDGETGEHVKRTGKFVDMITKALKEDSRYSRDIDDRFEENMWKAAPLHDIGKIKIPDAILNKPGRLTSDEFTVMKTHASEGGDIIEGTIGELEEQDYLDMAHDVARYHHERWDGTGYPDGLKGEEIPLCARIMAVADVFDALVSHRCYKEPMSIDDAYRIITEESGTHFDPEVVRVFVKIRPEIERVINNGEI